MPDQIKCYVINLASETKRRHAMEARLQQHGIDAEFFSAVDGRIMDDAELETHVDRAKAHAEYGPLTRAEIGTALSHIYIYRDMVQRNIPHAVILEDDVCLSQDFLRLLSKDSPDGLAHHFGPEEPVMVQLSHVNRAYRRTGIKIGGTGRSVVKPYGAIWLTSGYFITAGAARNLSTALYPVWTVADHWARFQKKGLLALRALTPNVVWESAEAQDSSIASERRARPKRTKTLASRAQRLKQELLIKPLFVRRLPKISA